MLAHLTPLPLNAPGNRSRWRHWKGHDCTVSSVGYHTETGELLVFYLEESSGIMFARPLASWHEMVYGKPRFEAIRS
jgi:hypothetical protein